MQKKIVGFFIVVAFGISLVMIPKTDAIEWDGSRQRRTAETNGVTVETDVISGQIMEVLDNDDTLFLRVNVNGNDKWAAIRKPDDSTTLSRMQAGNPIALQSGPVMKNYFMKGLQRNFDQVVFSPGVQVPRTRDRSTRTRSSR